jgi:hypothetical protein
LISCGLARVQGSAQETILKAEFQGVAKTTGYATTWTPLLFHRKKDVAKLCCLFLLNGNRILQQRFMPEDLSLRAEF